MPIRNPMEWFVAQFTAPAVVGSAQPAEYWPATPEAASPIVQKIGMAALREALRRGVHDFAAARTDVVFMCLIYPVLGLFIAVAESRGVLLPLLFPTAAGFALLGPLFATGLYEMSRQRELTGKISWLDTFRVVRSPQIFAIISLGLVLIGIFLTWLAVAQMIFDLTLGPLPPIHIANFIVAVFTTQAGWAMIGFGMAVGLVFAIAVLSIGVISFPLLLDRKVGFATAIATSRAALQHNTLPLAVWGLIVATGLLLGSLPCFIGLIVVLPVLGHSTWHLYRQIVRV